MVHLNAYVFVGKSRLRKKYREKKQATKLAKVIQRFSYQYDQLQTDVPQDICDIDDVTCTVACTDTDIAEMNEICLHSFSTNFAYDNEFDCSILDVSCEDHYSSSDEDHLIEAEDSEKSPPDKMPIGIFKRAAEEKRLKEEEEKKKIEEEERLKREEEERLRLEEERKREEEEKLAAEAYKLNEEIKNAKAAQVLAEAKLEQVRIMSGIYGTSLPEFSSDPPSIESVDDDSDSLKDENVITEQVSPRRLDKEFSAFFNKLADKQERASIADSGIDSPDYTDKNEKDFDLELKKNPEYEDESNIKPVLCCCLQ